MAQVMPTWAPDPRNKRVLGKREVEEEVKEGHTGNSGVWGPQDREVKALITSEHEMQQCYKSVPECNSKTERRYGPVEG